MTKVFLYLANRSIRAGFLILAVIGLRFLFRKLPKGPQLLLWAVVALRLAVPFSPESPWSLLPSAEPFSSQATINTPLQGYPSILQAENEIPVPATTEASHVITGATPTAATQPQTGSFASPGATLTASGLGNPDVFFLICTAVWLLGMAAMIAYSLISYLRLRKKLSGSLRQDGCIYICDEISSPFVLGLFRPRIYLPSDLSQAAKPYVLAHEQAHLCHGDAWWKLLGFLLLSVYWFHPLVWTAYALFCRDLEMACDERAVKGMDDRQRKDYACTLLLCAAPEGSFSVCPVAFSQNSIKARMDICGTDPTFGDIYGEISGSFLITDLAKLIDAMLAEPLLNKIWHAASYTVPTTQELVPSRNALLPENPLGLSHVTPDSRVTGGLTSVSGDYADMAVTAEYQGKRVLCILTGALRITHPYGDDPNSFSVVDYWGNYEETEKLLNIAFG